MLNYVKRSIGGRAVAGNKLNDSLNPDEKRWRKIRTTTLNAESKGLQVLDIVQLHEGAFDSTG
jgi:hypothetical protein